MKKHLALVPLAVVILFNLALGQPSIPRLEQRVSDFTNTLSYIEWSALEKQLKAFEDTTSTQVAVLVISSLNGSSMEEYANKAFDQNKIGQRTKNNGALVVVAKDDREVRIAVGYGLEGSLTDATCSQIIEREMKPQFREGNFAAGLSRGVSAIIAATAGEYKVEGGRKAPLIALVLVVAFLLFFFVLFLPMAIARRRYVIGRRGWMYYPGWGYMSGSRGSGFSGGFGRGSGFSGGGGLSGGGGATGRW